MNISFSDSLGAAITQELPKIEGVKWKLDFVRMPERLGRKVYLTASFEIDELDNREAIDQAIDKLHQITCGGQIRLEIER